MQRCVRCTHNPAKRTCEYYTIFEVKCQEKLTYKILDKKERLKPITTWDLRKFLNPNTAYCVKLYINLPTETLPQENTP